MVDFDRMYKQVKAELDLNPNVGDTYLYSFVCIELCNGSIETADEFFKRHGYSEKQITRIKSRVRTKKIVQALNPGNAF